MFKLVYDKQIHICDSRSIIENQSNSLLSITLDNLMKKIDDLFIKLPKCYEIYYDGDKGGKCFIENDEDLNQIIKKMTEEKKKIVKLYIKEKVGQQELNQISEKEQKRQNIINISHLSEIDQGGKEKTDKFGIFKKKQEKNNQREQEQSIIYHKIQQNNLTNIDQSSDDISQLMITLEQSYVRKKQYEELGEIIFTQCSQIEKEQLKQKQDQKKEQNSQFQKKGPRKLITQFKQKYQTHNIKCDICNISPIQGIRYKCVSCLSYDLCQNCQKKYSHEHPLLKICYSYQAPLRIQVQFEQQFNLNKSNDEKFNSNQFKKQKQFDKNNVKSQQKSLQNLTQNQKYEKVFMISNQISELLGIGLQQCMIFVQKNLKYSKQMIINMMLDMKFSHDDKNKFNKFEKKVGNFIQHLFSFLP